ncbi:MAG: hypothetical protein AB7Q23_02135 [Hyphomonadaceae bacterium]
MRHPLRVFALALAFAATPACAALAPPDLPNPLAAAQSLDQRAYALLHAYAAVVEEAADIAADPAAPIAFKRLLGEAERVATPSVELLQTAITAYLRARADFEAASGASQTTLDRAAIAFAVAMRRLNEAIEAAQAPIAELSGLVRARRER